MLEKGKITPFQLFTLITTFLIGSTVMFLSVNVAGRDTWISDILGSFAGVVLIFVITKLAKEYPNLTLIEYVQKAFGKILGKFIALTYLFYFLTLAALVSRNFDELFVSAIMPETPTWFFRTTLALTVGFLVYHRIEVVGRLGELVLPIVLGTSVITSVLLSSSGAVHFKNLLPILDRGLGSVLLGAVPIATFPYLELILFAMVIPYVNNTAKVKSASLAALAVAGMMLLSILVQNIAVYGEYAATLNFPRFSAIRLISVGGFVERIEPLVLSVWTIGSIIKIAVCLYAFVLGLGQLFGLRDINSLVMPSAILIIVLTGAVFNNNFEMTNFAVNIYPFFAIPFQVVIPVTALLLTLYKRRKKSRGQRQTTA